MNVGDYVRTKKGIAKIIDRINDPTNYFDKFWVCDRYLELNDDTEYIHKQDIIKSSSNIIDLIEVGDYVNGELVTAIHKNYVCDEIELGTALETACNYTATLNEDIKSIVTKEQFESMKYKVGE